MQCGLSGNSVSWAGNTAFGDDTARASKGNRPFGDGGQFAGKTNRTYAVKFTLKIISPHKIPRRLGMTQLSPRTISICHPERSEGS
ncbi:hypothetical protein FACS1894202_03020 [Clostridia bacterium]|nr:hypothetical protein FACS1894202_03020 [Clostridia bacterium]